MLDGIEIFFNLLWLFLLGFGAWMTVKILRKPDPFDEGTAVVEDEE
ncbi:hypothetical protein JJB07_10495 [Tumebacillus sp. ITR2]|uniref:Cbb3-type cytochrome c oxidase subunit 3 n=1 Tax=Tumebacillus amylolyticus TaxID=2801339 RepID=A0ABS1JAL4_9BACL|nr:hypothetical protein [Tumebacillus amylolyticus]MBL0387079.1 hypothetical protein [Tumebacillus amylolyticus]